MNSWSLGQLEDLGGILQIHSNTKLWSNIQILCTVHLPIRIHPLFARNLPQTVSHSMYSTSIRIYPAFPTNVQPISVDLATLFFLHGFMNLDVFWLGTTHTLLNHKKTANYHLPEPVLWKCRWSSHAPHYLCSRKDQSPDGDHGSWITSPVAPKVNSPRVFGTRGWWFFIPKTQQIGSFGWYCKHVKKLKHFEQLALYSTL